MFFLIVFAILCAVVTYFWWFNCWSDKYEDFWSKFGWSVFFYPLSLGFAFGGAMIICLVGVIFVDTHSEADHAIQLQQMKMGDQIEGSTFLGTGYVDEELVYSYYYKSDGGYRVDQIYADDALIVEDSSNPHIEVTKAMLPKWYMPGDLAEWDKDYIIHVPQGSVKPMINMDLPNG